MLTADNAAEQFLKYFSRDALASLVIYCRMYAVLSMEDRYSFIHSGEKLNLSLVGQLLRPEWSE